MYLLLTLVGVEEWQLPTEAVENMAFIPTVGSTQRIISRWSNLWRPLEWPTSTVRTNLHNPFRKLGPPKPCSAANAGADPSGAKTNSASAAERDREQVTRKLVTL